MTLTGTHDAQLAYRSVRVAPTPPPGACLPGRSCDGPDEAARPILIHGLVHQLKAEVEVEIVGRSADWTASPIVREVSRVSFLPRRREHVQGASAMGVFLVSVLIFVVTLGAALLGLYAHKRLPPEQKERPRRCGQVSLQHPSAIVLNARSEISASSFGGQNPHSGRCQLRFSSSTRRWAYGAEPSRCRCTCCSRKEPRMPWGLPEEAPIDIAAARRILAAACRSERSSWPTSSQNAKIRVRVPRNGSVADRARPSSIEQVNPLVERRLSLIA